MKKTYTIFLFLLTFFAFSQEIKGCKFDYKLNLISGGDNEINLTEAFVSLDWDFSKIKEKNASISIEIVPILDCFKDENAILFKDEILIKIDSKDFLKKDKKTLKHIDLMSKCFKYRVVINSNNCKEISDWKFYSYFNFNTTK